MAAGMNEPLYTIEILRLAASIPHLGLLEDAEGEAEVRSPTCGSIVSAQVRIDDRGRVKELGQQVQACAFGQASAALMGAHAIGNEAAEIERALADFAAWLNGSRDTPGDWPGLDVLAPARPRRARHGAMLLPFRALLAAVQAASRKEPRSPGLATGQ
jgi:NifU-like protein involved in Fe-S cluster formation